MQLLTATYGRRRKVHIMSTFFYTKLSRSGYPGVERWLKKVDMRRLRLLLVPVHVSMCHWALAAINFRTKVGGWVGGWVWVCMCMCMCVFIHHELLSLSLYNVLSDFFWFSILKKPCP